MSEDILEKSEFDHEDDEIAINKGNLIHKKIIPILLRPQVVFPFQTFHLEFTNPDWKRILDKHYEENSVIGVSYHPAEKEGLPPVGQVATSAAIDEIYRAVNGTYLVKFVPVNRFFTKEYVESDTSVTMAKVSYYWDIYEDDEILAPHIERLKELVTRVGEMTDGEEMKNIRSKGDIHLYNMYSYLFFQGHPKITEEERLVALWMYKLSLRLIWTNEILEESLKSSERVAKMFMEAKKKSENN